MRCRVDAGQIARGAYPERRTVQIRHQLIRTKTPRISRRKDDDCDLLGLHQRRP
jgi:hypothetical protein